jgi:hypothetical protein
VDGKYFTESTTFQMAMYHLVVGKLLGSGCFRDVFVCNLNPDWVVKFQRNAGEFDNVREWETWRDYSKDPKVKKWLAPCHYISPSGDILIQQRTEYLEYLPKQLPFFLTDVKPENYGMIKGQVVCHDYGYLYNNKMNTRMRKANWRIE